MGWRRPGDDASEGDERQWRGGQGPQLNEPGARPAAMPCIKRARGSGVLLLLLLLCCKTCTCHYGGMRPIICPGCRWWHGGRCRRWRCGSIGRTARRGIGRGSAVALLSIIAVRLAACALLLCLLLLRFLLWLRLLLLAQPTAVLRNLLLQLLRCRCGRGRGGVVGVCSGPTVQRCRARSCSSRGWPWRLQQHLHHLSQLLLLHRCRRRCIAVYGPAAAAGCSAGSVHGRHAVLPDGRARGRSDHRKALAQAGRAVHAHRRCRGRWGLHIMCRDVGLPAGMQERVQLCCRLVKAGQACSGARTRRCKLQLPDGSAGGPRRNDTGRINCNRWCGRLRLRRQPGCCYGCSGSTHVEAGRPGHRAWRWPWWHCTDAWGVGSSPVGPRWAGPAAPAHGPAGRRHVGRQLRGSECCVGRQGAGDCAHVQAGWAAARRWSGKWRAWRRQCGQGDDALQPHQPLQPGLVERLAPSTPRTTKPWRVRALHFLLHLADVEAGSVAPLSLSAAAVGGRRRVELRNADEPGRTAAAVSLLLRLAGWAQPLDTLTRQHRVQQAQPARVAVGCRHRHRARICGGMRKRGQAAAGTRRGRAAMWN